MESLIELKENYVNIIRDWRDFLWDATPTLTYRSKEVLEHLAYMQQDFRTIQEKEPKETEVTKQFQTEFGKTLCLLDKRVAECKKEYPHDETLSHFQNSIQQTIEEEQINKEQVITQLKKEDPVLQSTVNQMLLAFELPESSADIIVADLSLSTGREVATWKRKTEHVVQNPIDTVLAQAKENATVAVSNNPTPSIETSLKK